MFTKVYNISDDKEVTLTAYIPDISEEMQCSARTIYRFHNSALRVADRLLQAGK